jgi:FAD/FMN-containing dehydrogenase
MSSTFADKLSGRVFGPGEAGYAPEVAGFNTAVVHTPDLVVAAATAADVVEAVRFARAHGQRVAVQSTGHGAHTAIASGLFISTRRLDSVTIDTRTRTATIGAGARWAPVVAAAAAHGLAPVTGSSANVGVVGYILGGGLGPLARSHGFSSDYLLGLSVVTGAGDLIEASTETHPDLFWALRGGKVGLGIVTEVRLRLVPLSKLYGGSLFFEEVHIEAALRAWVAWTEHADPLVTTSIAIFRFPPLDFIPAPLRGRRLLSLRFAYPGATEEGVRLAAPLRAAAPVYLDGLAELPAAEIARIHNDPSDPGPSWVSGALLTHVDQQCASVLLGHFGAGTDSPFLAAEVRHLGGATARDVEGGSAVGGRRSAFTLGLIGVNPENFQSELPAVEARIIESLRPWLSSESNVNFAAHPRSARHATPAWPADTLARLAQVRRKYDPDAVFT